MRTLKHWYWRLSWKVQTFMLVHTDRCPQCTAKAPHHKFDCSQRYNHMRGEP